MKQKLLEMVQVTVPSFVYIDEIWKTKEVGPKKMHFFYIIWKIGQNNGFWPFLGYNCFFS